VLKSQLRHAACFSVTALNNDRAKTAIAKICNHHKAWPRKMPKTGTSTPKGHAKLRDCAQPANINTTNCMNLLSHVLRHDLEPLHRATLGVQHREAKAVEHCTLAALGHMAHFVGDKAAYGVELVVRI